MRPKSGASGRPPACAGEGPLAVTRTQIPARADAAQAAVDMRIQMQVSGLNQRIGNVTTPNQLLLFERRGPDLSGSKAQHGLACTLPLLSWRCRWLWRCTLAAGAREDSGPNASPSRRGRGRGGAAALYRPTAPHRTALTPGLPPVFAPRPPQESCRTSTTSEVMLSIEPRTEARSQRAEAAVIASGARRTTWGSRREPPSARRWRGAALAGVVAGGARGRLGAG